jgi:hypothetical protein
MDKLKTILETFVIFAIVYYLFNLLFIQDPFRHAIIKTMLSALGWCTLVFLMKPLFKRIKSKY